MAIIKPSKNSNENNSNNQMNQNWMNLVELHDGEFHCYRNVPKRLFSDPTDLTKYNEYLSKLSGGKIQVDFPQGQDTSTAPF